MSAEPCNEHGGAPSMHTPGGVPVLGFAAYSGTGKTTLLAKLIPLLTARGLRVGSHVRQGQVIGYIGMSGLATGPHVHYEFRVGGVHLDSRTVDLPSGAPVPKKYRNHFLAQTERLSTELAQLAALHLATAD